MRRPYRQPSTTSKIRRRATLSLRPPNAGSRTLGRWLTSVRGAMSHATQHRKPLQEVSCTVSVDMLSHFIDPIFLATHVVFDADQLQSEDLITEAGRHLNAVLSAFRLTLPASGELI